MEVEEVKNNNSVSDSLKNDSAAQSCPTVKSRRFSDAGEAANELLTGFNDWSACVSTYGMHMSYAVIAANWAVYGNAQAILRNPWAKYSVAIVIVFLGLNLFCTWLMTNLYAKQCDYANDDKNRWAEEFNNENTISSVWPYTIFIENLGDFIRHLKVWVPIVGGTVFILGLLFSGQLAVVK